MVLSDILSILRHITVESAKVCLCLVLGNTVIINTIMHVRTLIMIIGGIALAVSGF